ncbi:MAG: U32 family peptidase [Pseudoflavonifractor sp.]|nr:U32 family peptidase [Pseudoflavonifractor sp.]
MTDDNHNRPQPRPLELLAPARNADTAIEAVRHGADAVYIGAPAFGARAAAGNSLDDIRRTVDMAHRYDARIYATVNTILYDSELAEAERMIRGLYRAGVDALIVQDMGLLRLDLPPIALHASTQCDTRGAAKARFLEQLGFSQIVVAREMTLDEMSRVCRAVTVPVEAFVHGALCVSYSGDCHASCMTTGRSANRGECAQLCRLPYDLVDGRGRPIVKGRHLMSLRDLDRSAHLAAMADAGISSFKIEGRLKPVSYVKNVVACYRRLMDELIASAPDRYRRSSSGNVEHHFSPSLAKSFNRGFTSYFTDSERPQGRMASFATPKSLGERVGRVHSVRGNMVEARLVTSLANGDGLCYIDIDGDFHGFRLNRVEGNRLYAPSPVTVSPGTELYRNKDKRFDDLLAGDTATRTIGVAMTLRPTARGLALDLTDERGCRATAAIEESFDTARTPQEEARRRVLAKLGDTCYRLDSVDDMAGNLFVPASRLADLRRLAVSALDSAHAATYRYECRRPECPEAVAPAALTYHANVANDRARELYMAHGTTTIEPALETARPAVGEERVVMTTRYCLRRETGHCLKTPYGREWPRELYIVSGDKRFRLDFDCKECRMRLTCKT